MKKKICSVALVGRPNVGKSTLFNRLLGQKRALVYDRPGVTRDCRSEEVTWLGLTFQVTDTPGLFDADSPDHLLQGMRRNSLRSIQEADVVLWMLDGKNGHTSEDADLARILREYGKNVVVLINKSEKVTDTHNDTQIQAWQWGMVDVALISAEHGLGLNELYDALEPYCLEELEEEEIESTEEGDEPKGPLSVLILGRPNVGKSTLTNLILGEERQLVADQPGVTRDALAFASSWMGRELEIIDTAGIRRHSRLTDPVERMAVSDAQHRLRFAEMVIMVLDATAPPTIEQQDVRLMNSVLEEGRPLVLALNKWDKVAQKKGYLEEVQFQMEHHFAGVEGVPCIPLCARTGEGLNHLMNAVLKVEKVWNQRISTHTLNQWLRSAVDAQQPPAVSGRPIRLKYITQRKSRPPTFVIFGNQTDSVPTHYVRYLTKRLQNDFGVFGVPVRIHFQNSRNPFQES